MTRILYGVLRGNDQGEPWLDGNTIDLLPEMSLRKAQDVDRTIPHWAALHPIIKTVQLKVTVIE